LPYRANEKNVRDLFDEHGKVLNVRLMKDKRTGKRRGFGFVVVAAEDADKVISALNDAEYMQRTLKVRVANDPKHPSEDSAE
jgi:RNA recognition motif-containing protein